MCPTLKDTCKHLQIFTKMLKKLLTNENPRANIGKLSDEPLILAGRTGVTAEKDF